jgi:DNA-directed RNA polymerase specialized sigma subunit
VSTFDEIRPIIEGRLYEWGRFMSESPSPPISSAYRVDAGAGHNDSSYRGSSQQESWAARFFDAMRVATVVERVKDRLSPEQRLLVEARYKHRKSWEEIARLIHTSERSAYRVRDQALLIVAYELDLLRSPVVEGGEEGS